MESITLKLRALPHAVPPEVRLRNLLKMALRQHGMRCVDVAVDKPQEEKLPRRVNRGSASS